MLPLEYPKITSEEFWTFPEWGFATDPGLKETNPEPSEISNSIAAAVQDSEGEGTIIVDTDPMAAKAISVDNVVKALIIKGIDKSFARHRVEIGQMPQVPLKKRKKIEADQPCAKKVSKTAKTLCSVCKGWKVCAYRGDSGGKKCVRCYKESRAEFHVCKKCGVEKEGYGWKRIKESDAFLCNSCNRRIQAAAAKKICATCKVRTTSQWTKLEGKDICKSCYGKWNYKMQM